MFKTLQYDTYYDANARASLSESALFSKQRLLRLDAAPPGRVKRADEGGEALARRGRAPAQLVQQHRRMSPQDINAGSKLIPYHSDNFIRLISINADVHVRAEHDSAHECARWQRAVCIAAPHARRTHLTQSRGRYLL